MERRRFLQAGIAGLAAARHGLFADDRPKRVGLIGCGWYGKSDLFRLVQIAPVEIVSLCDVDKKNLEEAARWSEERQASKKKPRLFTDYRGRKIGHRCVCAETHQRGRRRRAGDAASSEEIRACGASGDAAPQYAA